MNVQKSSKGARLLHRMEMNLFGAFPCKRKKPGQQTRKQDKEHEAAINSQFMHAEHTRI